MIHAFVLNKEKTGFHTDSLRGLVKDNRPALFDNEIFSQIKNARSKEDVLNALEKFKGLENVTFVNRSYEITLNQTDDVQMSSIQVRFYTSSRRYDASRPSFFRKVEDRSSTIEELIEDINAVVKRCSIM
jgi:hypothetical protein